MFGAGEILIITLALVFMFGGNRVLDWVKKFRQARDEVKNELDIKPARNKII